MKPQNINKPAIHVKHSELKRSSENSKYKSECPVCEGMLLMNRHPETMALLERDRCILCGQEVIYDDLKEAFPEEIGL